MSAHGPSRMVAVATITMTGFRRLARDRIALFLMLVLPIVVIVVVGTTIGGGARHVPLGLLDDDHSSASEQVRSALADAGTVDLHTYQSQSALEQAVRTGDLVAGVVIPAGFGSAASAGSPTSVQFVSVQASGSEAAEPQVQSALDQVGSKLAAAAFVSRVGGVDGDAANVAVDQAAATTTPVGVDVRTVGKPQLENDNSFAYTVPSNLVLFLFITAIGAGAALVETRRLGIARRITAAPVRVGTIIAGFGGQRLLVSIVQATFIVVIGAVVFGVVWGQAAGVVVLVLVYACVGVGAALTVGAVAKNADQVQAIGIPLGVALGMLGGCMWPLDVVPAPLRAVGHLTPQAWAMDGFIGLVYNGEGLTAIWRDLLVLGGYAAVLLLLGTLLLRRTLTRAA